jgi:hypothetical protein
MSRHFGQEIVADRAQLSQSDAKVETLWLKMYKVGVCICDVVEHVLKDFH